LILSERAWKHIRERHPEVAPYRHLIAEILVRPEVLIRGERGESKAVGQVPKTHLGPKYLVVVYREASGQST